MNPQRFPIGALVRVIDLDSYEGTVIACEWREHQKSYVYTVIHPFLGQGSDAIQTTKRYWSEKALANRTPVLCDKHGSEMLWDHRQRPPVRCCPTCERDFV